MADRQKPPREEVSAPSHKVRAAYWFTILAVGSLSSALANSNILSIFLFPFLLGRILFLTGPWQPLWIREQGQPDWCIGWVSLIAAFMGPSFYIFHLIATNRVRTRRGFTWLMLIFAIVVFVNVLACWDLSFMMD